MENWEKKKILFAKKNKLDAEGKSDARADQKLLIFFVWPNGFFVKYDPLLSALGKKIKFGVSDGTPEADGKIGHSRAI